MGLDFWLELGEVVDCALAVGCSDHVGRVLPDVLRDLAPRCLDSGDGVGECAILFTDRKSQIWGERVKVHTYHVKQDSIGIKSMNV